LNSAQVVRDQEAEFRELCEIHQDAQREITELKQSVSTESAQLLIPVFRNVDSKNNYI